MLYRGGTLRRNLIRVFLLQALGISLAVILGVFGAAKVVERVLVNEALEGEAAHYWTLYAADPAYPRPNTRNLRGYLRHPDHGDAIPDWLSGLEPGFQRVPSGTGESLVHVSEHGPARLYLVFDEIAVSQLAFYFGVAPLSLVLLLVYTLTFIGYRLSRRAISPLVRLAEQVKAIDARAQSLKQPDFAVEAAADSEVQVLAAALHEFVERINELVSRERNFTRNASHELRTPLAVMRANLDAIQRRAGDNPKLEAPLARMRRTVGDMEKLLETLLILAREDEARLPREPMIVNDLLHERIGQVQRGLGKDSVEVKLEADCLLQVHAPQRVLAIVFDNILRNAISYTPAGTVTVRVEPGRIVFVDCGPGMAPELLRHIFEPFQRGESSEPGFGLGLAIVKRLCDRFGWQVDIDSEPGRGTTVTVVLPDAEVLGSRRAVESSGEEPNPPA
ncbi:sensor histidine kinase [Elongatibacter sediminis]|uniref:histidine kinase n=1 Tax=Elongatibacter sediminis TaxID=3119006 RepID=A0AAW9RBX0_9GAMM